MYLLAGGAGLCSGDGENFGVETIAVCVVMDFPVGDVFSGVKGIKLSSCEFSYLRCSVEDHYKAGEKSYVEGIGVVELVFD